MSDRLGELRELADRRDSLGNRMRPHVHGDTLMALLDVVEAALDETIGDHPGLHMRRTRVCTYCGRSWPCPWSILDDALTPFRGASGDAPC